MSLVKWRVASNLACMNRISRLLTYPAFALVLAVLLKLFWPHVQHHSPVDPKAFILDVGVEGSGQYQVSMWVPFGSTSDSAPGIAHVMEHLKFKTDVGNGFVAFDAIPGSSSNASTTYLTTRYDLNVPPAGLSKALETLSTMTKPLTITEDSLKLEKKIVEQELLQRTQSNPDNPFYTDFNSELYKGLPFEHPPIGTAQSVAAVSMKDVQAFDAAHYQGARVFVLIAGPVLQASDREAIENYFPNAALGNLTVGAKFKVTKEDTELKGAPAFMPTIGTGPIAASEFARDKISDRARSVKMTISKIISAPTSWQAVTATRILQDAISSRLPEGLQDKIAEDPRLVQSWSLSFSRLMDGVWQLDFTGDVADGVTAEQVRSTVEKYLADFATTGLSQASFERLKARYLLTSDWENAAGRANSLAGDSLVFGYDHASSYFEDLQKTTLQDVNDLLKSTQLPGRMGVALLKPAGAAQ